MENSENNWKKILEQGSDKSVFRPDTERVWEKIQTRQKKQRAFPVWITHIAAAVAGVLITLSFLLIHKNEEQNLVRIIKTSAAPEIIHDTVRQIQIVEIDKKEPRTDNLSIAKQRLVKKEPSKTSATQQAEKETEEKFVVQKERAATTEEKINEKNTIPAVTTPPAKPIHLADIENSKEAAPSNDVITKMVASKFSEVTYNISPSPIDIFK